MGNYASAACRHLPQGGKKIRPNQEVHFQSRVWGEVDPTATAKVHQTIRALDPTGFQSQIIVEEVFFIPCLFVVHAPKIPQCSIHCLSGKIFHGNFLFLLPSQAKPLFGDCLFIYYSALAVSWPAPTLSCSSDPRVVAKHSLTFILSPPRNPRVAQIQKIPRVAQIQKIQEAWIQKKRWIFQYCSKRARLIKFLQKFVNLWMKSCV